ncbi:nitronate monooxygenase [Rummeliibacillus sp. TYF005]|uniref:NAD(P)H-dependent flavin oxidoreductase n=1 Tax=Rummeliibacillus sp. TYF005 TaxID=2058214 RepID=UPI000F523EA0|nr:nitronate monooxygenase [Rummeliibacillus sp. TYF005]RPJ96778.1 nitronate monooxygenase [Rummeliibacillus sp. TYF005]
MSLLEKLKMKWPIIQAPMAGVTTPEMVIASAEAGILGSIGAGYLNADVTREFIKAVKSETTKPFAVNLFVPKEVNTSKQELEEAYNVLKPYRKKLMIADEGALLSTTDFDAQVDVIIEEDVKVCSFTFGLPSGEVIKKLHEHEIFTIGTATTIEEALLVQDCGLDAVVLQGEEAGGHRGSFIEPYQFVSLQKLLEGAKGKITIPIIAAGGIATKEHIQQAIEAGAEAVQIGTAFVVSEESGASEVYKNQILLAEEDVTALTSAFSGKPARGIENDFMVFMEGNKIAPYPYQNDLTKTIRLRAEELGFYSLLAMWAGKNLHLVEKGSVKDIVNRLTK